MAFLCKEPGVLCGLPVVALLFARVDPRIEILPARPEGAKLAAGEEFLEALGPPRSLLGSERIALNFLQRLCGIATQAARWAADLAGLNVELLDTRKTTPGWRRLEKYAVRTGGAANHRSDLSSGFLLKDNHAWLLRQAGRADSPGWVRSLRAHDPGAFLEIEVGTREEFIAALASGADALLLDNFSLEDLRWAVDRCRRSPSPRPLLEASGGIGLDRLRAVAETGVDRISAGALTHSARALDISLKCRRWVPESSGEGA
jgi:nicotinate-nucleotide pyrophosphorylase (carboxylating)